MIFCREAKDLVIGYGKRSKYELLAMVTRPFL